MLINFRNWLGLAPAKLINIPHIYIKILAKLGDLFGLQPLNSTSYKMLLNPSIADQHEMINLTGIISRRLHEVLATEPLTIPSLWHARLFLLKPILKLTLGLFWISTGIITSIIAPEVGLKMIMDLGFNLEIVPIMLYGSCFIDVLLGFMLITKNKTTNIYILQIVFIIAYTLILSLLKPNLWFEPLGPLTKNLPIIFLTVILRAIEKDK